MKRIHFLLLLISVGILLNAQTVVKLNNQSNNTKLGQQETEFNGIWYLNGDETARLLFEIIEVNKLKIKYYPGDWHNDGESDEIEVVVFNNGSLKIKDKINTYNLSYDYKKKMFISTNSKQLITIRRKPNQN
jgi:hypothetical protein